MIKKYLISLKKDIHRRELFFSQPNIEEFEVFDAVNTMNLSQQELEQQFDFSRFKKSYGREVTKGEIGCTFSHLKVYEKVLCDESIADNDYVLICEDDALFAQNFNENLTALLASENKADIILVGQSKILEFNDNELEINYPTTFKFLLNKVGGSQYSYGYPYRNYFAGTVAYLIKKSACRIFYKNSEQKNDIPNSVYWLADDFILFGEKFGLDIKIVRPLMAIENPNLTSNLESLRGSLKNNMFKKLLKYPVKKLMAIKRNY